MTNEELESFLFQLMMQKNGELEALKKEIEILNQARLSVKKTNSKTYIYDSPKELKKAMKSNFNCFDNFILREKD